MKKRYYKFTKDGKGIEASEELEQETLFMWTRSNESKYPELKLLLHIPNGGQRPLSEAKRFKAQGVKAGVPDLLLPVACNGYHGLFIEMKSMSGRASKDQLYWIDELNKEGYLAVICYGWTEAANKIMEYLAIDQKI